MDGQPQQSQALANRLGVTAAEFEQAAKPLAPQFELGTISELERMQQICRQLLRTDAVDAELVKQLVVLERIMFTSGVQLYPGVLELLETLRQQRLLVAICSNANLMSKHAVELHGLAEAVDKAVFSCDVGLAKPQAQIYLKAAALLFVDPNRCLFVTDGPPLEITAARQVGMQVVQVRHPDADGHLPVGQLDANAVIERIADLATLFQPAPAI